MTEERQADSQTHWICIVGLIQHIGQIAIPAGIGITVPNQHAKALEQGSRIDGQALVKVVEQRCRLAHRPVSLIHKAGRAADQGQQYNPLSSSLCQCQRQLAAQRPANDMRARWQLLHQRANRMRERCPCAQRQ